MDYEQLIRNWHAKAGGEDYFSKYVFEYLAFIGYLKRVRFINQNGDSNAIRALKQDEELKRAYLKKIGESVELRDAWSSIKSEFDEHPLGLVDENTSRVRTIWYWSCSCKEVSERQTHVCNDQGRIRNLEDWENMVEFWHCIRNNLFHGAKDPQDTRDALLVEKGYRTLRGLVDLMLI